MRRIFLSILFILSGGLSYAQMHESVESLLTGSQSGLQVSSATGNPADAVNINIRGVNSLNGSTQPLFIVDGVPLNPLDYETGAPFKRYGRQVYSSLQNSLLGFSVHDIKEIKVLKDISASSIYGSEGANGVILVTTNLHNGNGGTDFRYAANVDFVQGNHSHFAKLSGRKNNNQYYVSAFWKGLKSTVSDGGTGGFRFNLSAPTNNVFKWGISSSASMGSYGGLMAGIPSGADSDDDSKEYRTTDAFWLNFVVSDHFNIRADFGLDFRMKRRYIWYGEGTDLGMEENGAASVGSFIALKSNASLKGEYFRYFGKNRLSVTLQGDIRHNSYDGSVMNGFDFFNHSLKAKGISMASSIVKLHRTDLKAFTCGGYAYAAYDYAGIVGLDASLRIDSTPSYDFGKIWLYPSANVFWDVRKMFFLENDALSELKITAGYGQGGAERYVPYIDVPEYTSVYAVEPDDEKQGFYRSINRHISNELNAGVSIGFLSGRIYASLKYYLKHTSEIFTVYCEGEEFDTNGYWRYTDAETIFSQESTLRNAGLEFDLSADVVRRKNVDWNISLNASWNVNKVLHLDNTDRTVDIRTGMWMYSDVPGYSADSIVGYSKDSSGGYEDRTGDGKITEADMTVLGETLPKLNVSLNTSLRIHRFTIEAMLTGWYGNQYVDMGELLASEEKLTKDFVKDGSRIYPGKIYVEYDIPLGKLSSKMGLKVNLEAMNSVPVYGYKAFEPIRSIVAGIGIDF